MPMNAIYSPITEDLDKNWLRVLFRYFSMATSIETYGNKHTVVGASKLEELALFQILMSDLRDNYHIFSIRPELPLAMATITNKEPKLVLDMSDVGP